MANEGCFWFGTEDRMMWLPSPLVGASSTPSGWEEAGTMLNGGGWALHSWDTHKEYQFEWSAASSPQVAQIMKSYRDGSFGRGLLYFHDPSTWKVNVLPARWADPSMALRGESPSLIYGHEPSEALTTGGDSNLLPVKSAVYNITADAASTPTVDDSVFIPIPAGYTLHVAAFYSATGSAGVWVTPVNSNGDDGVAVQVAPTANDATDMTTETFSGTIRGVRVWVGRSSAVASTITLTAMLARLIKSDAPAHAVDALKVGPWYGGQGHSGCRFLQPPTYVTNSAVSGGRIGFAASFIEVGSWVYG